MYEPYLTSEQVKNSNFPRWTLNAWNRVWCDQDGRQNIESDCRREHGVRGRLRHHHVRLETREGEIELISSVANTPGSFSLIFNYFQTNFALKKNRLLWYCGQRAHLVL